MVERQLVYRLMQKDADPAAELVSCMDYLGFTDSAVYREGLEFLLQSQRPDGSWGNYERQKAQLGETVVDQQLYLHTTDVAIGALASAFQP